MDKIKAKMYLTKELIKQAAESKPDIEGRMLCTFSPDYDMISVKTNDEDSVGYKLTIYIRETGVTWSCLIGPEKEPIKRIKSTVLYQYDPDMKEWCCGIRSLRKPKTSSLKQ